MNLQAKELQFFLKRGSVTDLFYVFWKLFLNKYFVVNTFDFVEPCPANIYLLKFNNAMEKKVCGIKYVQNSVYYI